MSSKNEPYTRPGTCVEGGSTTNGSRPDHAPAFVTTRSSRSRRKGIHPIWLSENAIFRCGNRSKVPDNSQSVIDMYALSDVNAVVTPAGASALVRCITEPDPMCMQTTVFVSSHAAKSGSQWRFESWIDGRPRFAGSSVNVIAF